MSEAVRIFLTGRLCVEGPGGTVVDGDLPGNQARLALALLVHERRPVRRDRLADVVWDGRVPDGWSRSLNAIVSKLRRQLQRAGLDGAAILVGTGGSYALSLPAGTWVDTEDAIRRVDRAEGAVRHGDHASAVEEATVAAGILRRTFLAGVEGEWVADVRRQLDAVLYRASVVLASGWIARGDHQLAVTVAERMVEIDPFREIGYRLIIEAELGRGDTIAALEAFDRCERVIRDEFGAAPSEETTALVERARRRPSS